MNEDLNPHEIEDPPHGDMILSDLGNKYKNNYIMWEEYYEELCRALGVSVDGLSKIENKQCITSGVGGNIFYTDSIFFTNNYQYTSPVRQEEITLTDRYNGGKWGFDMSRTGNVVVVQLKSKIITNFITTINPTDMSSNKIRKIDLQTLPKIFNPSSEFSIVVPVKIRRYTRFTDGTIGNGNLINSSAGIFFKTNGEIWIRTPEGFDFDGKTSSSTFDNGYSQVIVDPTTITYHSSYLPS
jgi:hypothetical protein